MQRKKDKILKSFLIAIKIAIGCSASIAIAEFLQLEFYSSAGIITLLSIVTTKLGTFRISIARILSFGITLILTWICFKHIQQIWLALGVYIFLLVLISHFLSWKDTISVNAVAGTHFMTTLDFSWSSMINELLLVLIGVSVAMVLNLFHGTKSQKKRILDDILYVEEQLQMILGEIASYLRHERMNRNVWDDTIALEAYLEKATEHAYEYQDNTFVTHPEYYIHYMDMRTKQCSVIHNLHYQIKKISYMPKQAEVIADYIVYMKDYVLEMNIPQKQIDKLHEICDHMNQEELPTTYKEFESRAILYHILMDLEEFLVFKKRFVKSLSKEQWEIYWKDAKQAEHNNKKDIITEENSETVIQLRDEMKSSL